MAERSMVLFDEGKMTGSSMSSNVIGSDAPVSTAHTAHGTQAEESTEELVRDLAHLLLHLLLLVEVGSRLLDERAEALDVRLHEESKKSE